MGNCMKRGKGALGFNAKILNKDNLEPPVELLQSEKTFFETFKISKTKFRKSGAIDVIKVISIAGRNEMVAKTFR